MAERIRVLLTEEEVDAKIQEIGEQISKDYAGQQVHLVCVLKGGSFFMCELAKYLKMPVTMDFMKVSSYGDGTESSGKLNIELDVSESLEGEHVLLVEDIVDTGRTLKKLKEMLLERNLASFAICALLNKPSRRVSHVDIEYTGFVIEDKFVIGFGLDYAQRYRNLPYIGVITEID